MSLAISTFTAVRSSAALTIRGIAQTSPYLTGLELGLLRLRAGTYSQWDVRAEAVAYYGRPGPEAPEAIEGYLDALDDSDEMPEAEPVALSAAELRTKSSYVEGVGDGIYDLGRGQYGDDVAECRDPDCSWCSGYNDAPAGDP